MPGPYGNMVQGRRGVGEGPYGQFMPGIPTAQQEALQEPVIDPVMLLANMGAGAFENLGRSSAESLMGRIAASKEPFALYRQLADAFRDDPVKGYPMFSKLTDLYHGAVGAIRPTLGTEFYSAAIRNRPAGYNSVRIGSKPTSQALRAVDVIARQAEENR